MPGGVDRDEMLAGAVCGVGVDLDPFGFAGTQRDSGGPVNFGSMARG